MNSPPRVLTKNGNSHQQTSLVLLKLGKDKNARLNKKESLPKTRRKNKSQQKQLPTKARFNSVNRYEERYRSEPDPFSKNRASEHKENHPILLANNKSNKSCFPMTHQYSGFLDVRSHSSKRWKRRYFVVNNNFLLSAATPHASSLERMICLEGSKISKHLMSSDMTFELFIRKHKLYFRCASPKQCETWTKAIEGASKLKIKDIYRFLYELGEGQSNVKVIAGRHKTTNEDVAIKIVDKRNCDKKMLKTEIQILKKIDSDYIVSIFDLIETKKYLYIVMEKCFGGELFDRIAALDGDGFSEEDTCLIMHQLCRGVKYMNDRGIVHRDLKPENVLCCNIDSIRSIKICDFGISKMLKKSGKRYAMTTLCGTMSYTAPEILKRKAYDYTVDYWSIGVIMYILLCGYPPYYAETDKELEDQIINDCVEFEDEDWTHISKGTRNLVKGLLNKDPRKRLAPNDVLKLTWKVSNKSLSFRKSQLRFKQTVLRAKMHRHSLSKFEADSVVSRNMFKVFKAQKQKIIDDEKTKDSKRKSIKRTSRILQKAYIEAKLKNRAKDDISTPKDDIHAVEKYERKIASFRGKRRSKGTEELLELKLPIAWTEAQLDVIEDVDDN